MKVDSKLSSRLGEGSSVSPALAFEERLGVWIDPLQANLKPCIDLMHVGKCDVANQHVFEVQGVKPLYCLDCTVWELESHLTTHTTLADKMQVPLMRLQCGKTSPSIPNGSNKTDT